MLSTLISLLLIPAFAYFAAKRLLRYLHILQQDDYSATRFIRWIGQTGSFDKTLTSATLIVAVMELWLPVWYWSLLVAILLVAFAIGEPDPRKEAKKKLVMTARAVRLFTIAFVLAVAIAAVLFQIRMAWLWALAIQLVPLLLIAAKVLLAPLEALIQRHYWNEARARLSQVNPTVIGVTGSFGKTSVKHILGHVLEMNARTFFASGSVNTAMGTARAIRESLPDDCRYFVAEMGAYGRGSIKRLCKLTPPDVGIITSIGEAHYERFKSLSTVAQAKFELAEAVFAKKDSRVVIHENVMSTDYARAFVDHCRAQFVICGPSPSSDLVVKKTTQDRNGLKVEIGWRGKTYNLAAPLYGLQHADNVALAFACAVTMGIAADRVAAALRSVPQIKHRLEVKTAPDGSITIDDAFNSNPKGFAAALDLLSTLKPEGGRRILITPGIIELGEKNDSVHAALGRQAARCADVVLAVRSDRFPSFADAYRKEAGDKASLLCVADLAQALDWLNRNRRPADVVLLENDLPDVFERRLRI